MLAHPFPASFFSGKGRGNQEALEGLLWGVGSLEGSLGLLSQDFRPCTVMNPPSLVGGGHRRCCDDGKGARLRGGCGGQFSSEGFLRASAPLLPGPAPPRRPFEVPEGRLHLPGSQQVSLLHHPPPWEPVLICSVGVPSLPPMM